MHSVKRRKLDQPQLFHNKPFRSPLRAPKPPAQVLQPQIPDSVAKTQPSPSVSSTVPQKTSQESPDSASTARLGSANVDIGDLQKHHTALSIRLTQLRRSLESAEQALQIEASGQDAELKKLITKWRTVAQETADELFVDAKERIDSMGGVVAWRRRVEEGSCSWNDDEEKENTARRGVDDSRGSWSQRDAGATDEHKLSEREEDDEECSFTMEMMLHQMNIDLQAIGFDNQLERWVE